MTIKEVISAIEVKHKKVGITIYPPASMFDIGKFERKLGFELPADFKEFYSICNGFECDEDIFRMVNLEDALEFEKDYGHNWFHFSEYMIYSDMWTLRRKGYGEFEILNIGDIDIVLTSSLHEFLTRFLVGNVFEKGGLYDWHKEMSKI